MRALVAALVLVVVGRLVIFGWPVYPDEAGFFMVAEEMLRGGDGLYGHYWVDRPPVLIWLFTLGALLGDVLWMRVLASLLMLVFVVLVWATVRQLGGRAGWAAIVAAAFAVSPAVGAETANGEAFAIPLVAAGVYAVVRAVGTVDHRAAVLWGLAAGFAGALAVSVKQNFADVFVFAVVLLVGLGLRRQRSWATVARVLAAGVGGAGLVGAVMVTWTLATGSSVHDLWVAVVQFRVEASAVLEVGNREGIDARRTRMTWRALAVGLIPFLALVGVMALWLRFRVSALSYAVGVLLVFEAACVVAGGNYWTHYLMGLAPGVALAVGAWGRRVVVRGGAVYVVVALLLAIPLNIGQLSRDDTAQQVGRYVGAAAEPGDTLSVMYGNADLQWASGMRSPYRHLWSLPVRVLDPDLDEFTALLASEDGPTWLVQKFARHHWGLDPQGQLDPVMRGEYDLVWEGCGTLVWLREGAVRALPEEQPSCAR